MFNFPVFSWFLSRSVWLKLLIVAVSAAIIFAIVFFGNQFFKDQRLLQTLPGQEQTIIFVEAGLPERYVVSEKALVRVKEPFRENGMIAYEHHASPFSEDERVSLASVPGIKGMVIGILKADDSLEILVSGETNKSNILVRSDGLAVYAATKIPPQVTSVAEPKTIVEEHSDTGTLQEGRADGPVATDVAYADLATRPGSELFAVNIKTREIRALGSGRSPRLLANGSILALANDGVVVINPDNASRTVLLERAHADGIKGGISFSGNSIAVEASDGQSIDFYRLSMGPAYMLTHIGFLQNAWSVRALAFTDDEHFFIRESVGAARLYSTPTEKLPVATPRVVMGIIQ